MAGSTAAPKAPAAAAPECDGPGWWYREGSCYIISSRHTPWLRAEEICAEMGARLVEIYDKAENDHIKQVGIQARSQTFEKGGANFQEFMNSIYPKVVLSQRLPTVGKF